ncbi:hypothetical protein Ddc_08495 [Ditylenchus destructor]|nr:hypothetical protein Ddc_08495 [Ditylenchus destructor]
MRCQLRKSQSVLNDIHAPISNQQEYRNGYDPKQYLFGDHRRTGSVKSRTSNGTQGGSGFLRNLFSNSSSTAEKPQRECYDDDYFSNQSIWTEASQSSKPTSAFPVDGLQSIPSNNFGSGDYSHAQCEMNTTVDSCNKSTSTVQSDKSSKRTGFARLRSTFRMPFSSAGLPPTKSKDDTNCRNLTNEVVLARQLAFRRTNTDLCAESVHRLIGHHSMDGSPPPKLSNGATNVSPHRRSLADAQRSQAITALHRHHKIHQKVAPVQQPKESPKSFLPPPASKERKVSTNSLFKMHNRRSSSQSGQSSQREAEESKSVVAPLIPPQGRQKMDESVVKQCLAEIRNKSPPLDHADLQGLRAYPPMIYGIIARNYTDFFADIIFIIGLVRGDLALRIYSPNISMNVSLYSLWQDDTSPSVGVTCKNFRQIFPAHMGGVCGVNEPHHKKLSLFTAARINMDG